ncbi:hypothetical protein ABXT08_12415 [Chryseobacterium sp. NRRL B-14859]|uniref:hypothetical protein n=1 Tax=Chryseobacterium sp. NRRL B-14859 TaxID=1562763 RepID=UPI003390F0D4
MGEIRAGVWSLPLMLNGDSGFSANSKPISGVTDVPAISTVDESSPEEMITLFRGVYGKHPDLINAYMGSAIHWEGYILLKNIMLEKIIVCLLLGQQVLKWQIIPHPEEGLVE